MTGFLQRAVIGVALAAVVAYAGVRARSLTRGGATAATIVGTVAVAAGWNWAALLIIYFAVSTLLSRHAEIRRRGRTLGVIDKPGARDATQVFANGLPFVACCSLALLRGDGTPLWMIAGAGSLAASTADTWATEVGTMVAQQPHSIITRKPLEIGQSGGVTLAGSAASVAGAVVIATAAVPLMRVGAKAFVLIVLAGLAGSFADSIVGALLQRRSWCDACGRGTEMRIHECGTATRHVGGLSWLENDGVNLIATTIGAALPMVVALLATAGVFQ